jgi:hypothetical protein
MNDTVAVFAPYYIGLLLLGFPGWVTSQFYSRTTDRSKAFRVAALAGGIAAVSLHVFLLWLSRFDPVAPEGVADGTADLYRLGGYPSLGWYPVAAALLSVALSLSVTRKRNNP